MTTSRHRWLAHLLPSLKFFIIALGVLHIIAAPGPASAAPPSGQARAAAPQVGAEGGEPGQQKQLWPRSLAVSRAQRNERVPEAPQEGRPPGHNGRTAADIQEVAAHNDAQALLAASADARDIARRPGRLQ